MRVARLIEPKKIEVTQGSVPEIKNDHEVLVRVKAVGICGTDLHIFQGERGDVKLPRIMGHELSGLVEKVGPSVQTFKAGDPVMLDPVISCGTCSPCKKGRRNVCVEVQCFGVQVDGGFQDYILVNEQALYPIPGGITFEQAALAEPFSIAANIVSRTQITAKDRVLILGAGTIGLTLLQGVKNLGASVLISDVEDAKLSIAELCGADKTINSKKNKLSEGVELFSPGGMDVIIDAVGIAPLVSLAVELAAPTARIGIIGFDTAPAQIPPVLITKKELTLVGSRMNCNRFPEVLEWFKQGNLKIDPLISRKYPVEAIQSAFEETLADSKHIVKTLILF